jgi:hypothetical protein
MTQCHPIFLPKYYSIKHLYKSNEKSTCIRSTFESYIQRELANICLEHNIHIYLLLKYLQL